MYKLDSVYKIDSFWYTFGNPFLTTLVICVAVAIACLILYLCTIFAIATYKKRKRLDSASNGVNIEAIQDFKEISGIRNNNDNYTNNEKIFSS